MSNNPSNSDKIDNSIVINNITTDDHNINENCKFIVDINGLHGGGKRIDDNIDSTTFVASSNSQDIKGFDLSTETIILIPTTTAPTVSNANSNNNNNVSNNHNEHNIVSSLILQESLTKLNITQKYDDNTETSDNNSKKTRRPGRTNDDNPEGIVVPLPTEGKYEDKIDNTISSTGYDDNRDADTAVFVQYHLSQDCRSKQLTSIILSTGANNEVKNENGRNICSNRKATSNGAIVGIQQCCETSVDDFENKTNFCLSDNNKVKGPEHRNSILKNPNPVGNSSCLDIDSTEKVATSSAEESSELKKRVSFTTVQIKQYAMELGDNPSCSHGPPVQLSWEIISDDTYNYDDYSVSKRSKSKKVINYYTKCLERNESSNNKDSSMIITVPTSDSCSSENDPTKSQSAIQVICSIECTDDTDRSSTDGDQDIKEARYGTCQHNSEYYSSTETSKSTSSKIQGQDASDGVVNAEKLMDINHYEELRMLTRRLKPRHYVLNSFERHRIVRNAGHTHQAIESAIKSVALIQQQRMRSNFFPITVERKIRHISKKLSFPSLATKAVINKFKGRNNGSKARSESTNQNYNSQNPGT